MKTLFKNANVDLNQLREEVIYLMEAFGFECTRREMPEIYIDSSVKLAAYYGDEHVIRLSPSIANGDFSTLLITLAHELTHSLQPRGLLNPFGVPYHLRVCEEQAYTVQHMYGVGITTPKPVRSVWKFLCRYGNRRWFRDEYTKIQCWMQQDATISNYKDSQTILEDKLHSILQ